jgi:cytochrome c oxidase subunit I
MGTLHVIATYGLYGLWIYQIPFIINVFMSFFTKRTGERNPWRSSTMEWLAPSPPGHGNFEELPECYRGPYEYSKPGAPDDFIPQWVPDEVLAKGNSVSTENN